VPLSPSGELTSIGIAKETTYGSPVVPSIFLISDDSQFFGANEFLERPGSRRRVGRTKPATGGFTGKGTANFEFDPDNTGCVLQLAIGNETVTANANNPTAVAVATTLTIATLVGFVDFTPASMTGITVGQSLTIDAETTVVKAITTNTFRAYAYSAHAVGATIVNAALVLAYDHTFTLGSPRGFFTSQINRVIDAIACTGCKVSSMSVSVGEKAIISGKVNMEYQNEVYVASPATPVYSTLFPFKFQTAGNVVTIDGAASDASVQAWSFTVDTGLITDFPSFGTGRLRGQMPETMSKVSGTLDMAFETDTMYQKFWGKRTATGPQSLVLPVNLSFVLASDDWINTAMPYAMQVIMGTAMLSANDVAIKSADYLKQACKFEAYESINGAADDIKIILTNAASGASI
jgi:hypothetical protein